MLEKEHLQTVNTLKEKKEVILQTQGRISLLEQELVQTNLNKYEGLQRLQILEAKCDSLKKEIEDQTTKKERALIMAKKASKQHRKKLDTTNEELDIFIKSTKEIGTLAMKDLEKLVSDQPDMGAQLSAIMQSQGLQPPSRSVSRVSSRASYGVFSSASSGRNSVQTGAPAAEAMLTQSVGVNEQNIEGRISASNTPIPRTANLKKVSTLNVGGNLGIKIESVEFPPMSSQQRLPPRRTPANTMRSTSSMSNGSRKSVK
jgi:hypothetical protein